MTVEVLMINLCSQVFTDHIKAIEVQDPREIINLLKVGMISYFFVLSLHSVHRIMPLTVGKTF